MKSQDDRPVPEIPHTRAAQICGFPREFVTLRVAQFAIKIAQLAISMERLDYGSWWLFMGGDRAR